MSPETGVSSKWSTMFSQPYVKKNLVVVAVDEAHCVEEWLGIIFCFLSLYRCFSHNRGESFRISFRKIGGLRALCDAPFMALTATASPVTQRSIADLLDLRDPCLVSNPLDRPNIFFSVAEKNGIPVSVCFVGISS